MEETRIVLRNVGKIDPMKVEDYVAHQGYDGLRKALNLSQDEIIAIISESGLRGRGGAGFPAGRKWSLTKNVDAEQKYIICNADEGEPGTNKDRVILAGDPFSVFEGMTIAGYATGASKGFIYLRTEYPYLRNPLKTALADARAKGYLGTNIMGSGFDFDIELYSGAGAYVCGDETALIESLEGKRGEPRYKPPYPGVQGLWGSPTVVNNVETLANVAQILERGAEWFKSIGAPTCTGTKLFTLCGNISRPGVYEFPMGTNLKDLFEQVGGGCPNGKALYAIQTGGASGRIIRADQIDMAMDVETCANQGASLGSGAIMFIDETQDFLGLLENLMEFFVDESCGKCTPCREGNMRMLQILHKFDDGEADELDIKNLQDLADTMNLSSVCGLGQTAPSAVISSLEHFRSVFDNAIERGRCGCQN